MQINCEKFLCKYQAKNCKEWREKWFQANYVDIEEKRLAQEAEKKKQEEEEKRIAVKTMEPETTLEPVKKPLVFHFNKLTLIKKKK